MTTYNKLEQLLEKHNLMVSAAELHGVLSGLICGGVSLTDDTWQSHLNELVNDGYGLPVEIKQLTQSLFQTACAQLNGHHLDFGLLQPDEESSLRERLQALTTWVQSYLAGFGILRSDLKQTDEQIQELIRDFSEISQLSMELDDDDESNEQAYLEVYEYIRIGAISCFEQFNQQGKAAETPTLH